VADSSVRTIARKVLPPIVVDAARWLRGTARSLDTPEWEYVPEGWARRVRGWNVQEILDTYRSRWPAFLSRLSGAQPLGQSHENPTPIAADYAAHNTIMTFGYVLALCARRRERLSILDFGGGIGHYYALAQVLLPDVAIEYTSVDLPLLAAHGRALFPAARFLEEADETWSADRFDLVLCSASLQYRREWQLTLARLLAATREYLLVTRVPVVEGVPSFVVLQRAHSYGYATEYLGWFFNRQELLAAVGAKLVREFLIDERPFVKGAPAQGDYRGFLFLPREVA
jgi:putative methyltransferase (TIGR04325 family)